MPVPPSALLDRLLDRFADLDVVVLGETFLDEWLTGPSRGLSREAPVPVVTVAEEVRVPGAAANTARGLAALGGRVRFVSAVGDDDAGRTVRRLLGRAGVDVGDVVTVPGRRTVTKRRVMSAGHLLVRCDSGDSAPVDAGIETELVRRLRSCVGGGVDRCGADAVLVADYGAGLLTEGVIDAVGALVAHGGAPLVVDAHDPARWARARPHAVKPDAEEVESLLDGPGRAAFRSDRLGTLRARGDELRALTGAHVLVATLDRDGALVLEQGAPPHRVFAEPLPVAHTTGAGDTFAAAFTLALAAGAPPAVAAEVGAAAAAVVVREPGTRVATLPALRDRLGRRGSRLLPVEGLAACADTHRALGRRVVVTNGCFDVLHRGHVAYLDAAKACGDVLIVALNSDASTARLKGPGRPVNPVEDRVAVLAGLSSVDHVVVFDGDTPADLLRLVRPDVYVKGGDYTEEMLREAPLVRELGGEVRIVDYVEDQSTTGLLERVRSAAAPAAPGP